MISFDFDGLMKTATQQSWSLSLFGKLRLSGESFSIDQFDTKRSAHLLARLALSHRHAISRADAADFLWPDDFYDATRIRLRQELSRLRRALGPARAILDTDEEWIRLADQDLRIDVAVFENLFKQARLATDPEIQLNLYQQALDMSSQELLYGFSETWIDMERRRLGEIRYAVLVDLASLKSKAGEHAVALDLAQAAIEKDPLREAGHLLVMQELGQLGHLTDALDQYQQLKRLLRDETQTTPSEAADRLAETLRQTSPPRLEPRSVAGELTYHVPAPTEPIYGRESEIANLKNLLGGADSKVRLLTLTGPGGIGKTRLANEVASELASAFDGRVAWIPVADLSDASLIPYVVVKALGITIGQSADPMDRLMALLPRDPMLLLIDNVEQLLPEAASVIKEIAESRPNLRILVTSRVALNLAGERIVPVPPLPIPGKLDSIDQPALRIFLDPLLAEQGFQLPGEEVMAIIRQIAGRLEGFPLALQLASARLRTMSAADLLGQLDNRLDALINRRSDAPERHRTLRAALSGSYQALDPQLQNALGRVAVFRGGWTQQAAARVCGLEDSLPILEGLLDASLIRVDREDRGLRFRMFETIRDFALQSLTEEERMDAHREHTDWILELGLPIIGRIADDQSIEYFKVIDPEIDNLREACRFTLEHDWERGAKIGGTFGLFWYSRGLGREALRFLAELLNHRNEISLTADLARSAYARSQLLQASHIVTPGSEGPPAFEIAAELCEAVGLRVERAMIKTHVAHTLIAAADMDGALRLIEEAASELDPEVEPRVVAFVKHGAAAVMYYQGRLEEAIELMRQARETFDTYPAPFSQVQNLQMLAFLYYELRDLEKAQELASLALQEAEVVGSKHLIPMCQEVLARVALDLRDYDLALRWAQASADGWEAYGNMFQFTDQIQLIGRIEVEMGDYRAGLGHIGLAAKQFKRMGIVPFIGLALHGAAKAWLGLGEAEKAARILGATNKSRKPMGEEDRGTELAYVTGIMAALQDMLGEARLKEILANSPSVDEIMQEEFPD